MPAIDRRRPPVLPHAADSTGRRAAIGYPRMMGGNPMKTLRRMAGGIAAITLLALGGCVGAVAEGAHIAKDKATVPNNIEAEIGRDSGRERGIQYVYHSVVAVTFKKKTRHIT